MITMKNAKYILALIAVLFCGAIASSAQTKRVTVKFKPGTSEATYTNTVSGYGTVDFIVGGVKANQQMTATLTSSTGDKAILTVLRNGERIADDAAETTDWTGNIPADGAYTVRVGMTRNDARSTKGAVKFTLLIRVLN